MTPEFRDGWRLLSENLAAGQRRWIMRNPDNPDQWIVKTETWVPSLVAEANEIERNATAGQRFGNGFRKVASIPMSILYGKELLGAHRADDQKYLKKFLNRSENRWMRTFDGEL